MLRIARFPYIFAFPVPSCPDKWRAYELQKQLYLRAGSLWAQPVNEVFVPHTHRAPTDRHTIPVYVRSPATAAAAATAAPTVILMTGLDGYRPDNTVRCDEFLARGWAVVVVEVPGTADCPADPADPLAPERLWDSLLAWMAADGRFDMARVMAWGLSCGGYYALRIAHTHKDALVGVVAQGAGSHYFFDADWIDKADGHEYPFL